MIEKDAKKFLRRMIQTGGFIADGVYEEHPRFWKSNNSHSYSLVDLGVLGYLKRNGYIQRDRAGRYVVTEAGIKFARPWYQKLFGG